MNIPKYLVVLGFLLVVTVSIIGSSIQPMAVGSNNHTQNEAEKTTIAFEDISKEAGLAYEANASDTSPKGMVSDVGVYAADVDKDGWTDLLAIGGERPVLFKNDQREFQRSDALPPFNRTVRSALFIDYDADGWEDLLLLSDNREPLLLKNDRGSFERVDAGFDEELAVPIGATTADYDKDGCADFFVIQNGRWADHPPLGMQNVSVPLDNDNGKSNVLFEGTCSEFDRAKDPSINGTRWSLATSFVDLTGDGFADIHVANDFNRDILYVNQQNGSFNRVILSDQTDRNGMASEIADVTGDDSPDIFTTNIYHPQIVKEIVPEGQKARANGNTLLVNRGKGTFDDQATELNVRQGGWGWAALIEDLDNDMDQDLFHTTQRIDFDRRSMFYSFDEAEINLLESKYPSYRYPLIAARNDNAFNRKKASDVGFADIDGRGAVTLDFDRDGRLDIVVANADGEFKLYRNVGKMGAALQVALDGDGEILPLGATVTVTAGENTMARQYTSNSDFLSQNTRTLHFGTGDNSRVDVTIEWSDGTIQTFHNIATGQRIRITPTDGIVQKENHYR